MPYKPQGYTSVAPYLLTKDARRVIDFLTATFNAQPLRRMDDPATGAVRHAEFRIDDTVIMLAEPSPDYPAMPSMLHVYVKDVDATYAKALAAGATPIQPPTVNGNGDTDKRGGVKDPTGNQWWMATQPD